MQFRAFEPGIEVWGLGLSWMVAGFRIVPETGLRYLTKHGLTVAGPDGKPRLETNAWYPLESWLSCFEAICREVGSSVMFDIGRHVGANAPQPPHIDDIDATLRSLDVTYHHFHRKNGVRMFDAATGKMLEGIGHYEYRRAWDAKKILVVCENPYPCDFDLGNITGFATRFEPRAKVAHDDEGVCRKRGAERCSYVITW